MPADFAAAFAALRPVQPMFFGSEPELLTELRHLTEAGVKLWAEKKWI